MGQDDPAQARVPMGTAIFQRLADMVAAEWQPESLEVRVLPGDELVHPEDHQTYGPGAKVILTVRGFQLHREVSDQPVIALKVQLPTGTFGLAASQEGGLAMQVRELPLSAAAAAFEQWFDLNIWRAFEQGESGWEAVAQWLGIGERSHHGGWRRFGHGDLLNLPIFN